MVPFSVLSLFVFLLIWGAIGLVVGWLTGRLLPPPNKHKAITSALLGFVGSLTGMYASGSAWLTANNTGGPRSFIFWDQAGNWVGLQTVLAEHQMAAAIFGAFSFVLTWHMLAGLFARLRNN